jgi:hypothetical protein
LVLGTAILLIGRWGISNRWGDKNRLGNLVDSEDEGAFAFEFVSGCWRRLLHNNFRELDSRGCCCFVRDLGWNLLKFLLFVRDFDRATATWNNTISITFLKLPQSHVTPGFLFVVMLVRVCRRKPCRA